MDKIVLNSKTPDKSSKASLEKIADIKSQTKTEIKKEVIKEKLEPDAKVDLSNRAKDLKKSLKEAQDILKVSNKNKLINKPGVYFVSGFDWFGAGSIKGNYDGIRDMADAVKGADHFSWDQQDEIIEDIRKRDPKQPIVLIGHSFGGDGVVEIAERLNTLENGFRKIDLMVTLDSVGFDNDMIPQNVKKNLNYLAQGPYKFLNDGPNIALNYERTKVENYLQSDKHAELDDNIEIQMKILEEISSVLS